MILWTLHSGILEFSFPYWFPVYKSETDRLLNDKETRKKRIPSIHPLPKNNELTYPYLSSRLPRNRASSGSRGYLSSEGLLPSQAPGGPRFEPPPSNSL